MQFVYSAPITWNAGFFRNKERIHIVNYSTIYQFGRKASANKRNIKYVVLSYSQKDHFCILSGPVTHLEIKLFSYGAKSKYETKKFRMKRNMFPPQYQTNETTKSE